eukprot:SAG25_NODE_8784_length_404_cov_1.127869_1_plen_54_part_10
MSVGKWGAGVLIPVITQKIEENMAHRGPARRARSVAAVLDLLPDEMGSNTVAMQ